jgi:hypothetical protein
MLTNNNKLTKAFASGSLAIGVATLASLAVSTLFASSAQATTLSTPPQTITTPFTRVPYTKVLNFTPFNSSLGTLTDLLFTQTIQTNARLSIFNANSTSESFSSAQATVPVTVSGTSPIVTVSTTAVSSVIGPGVLPPGPRVTNVVTPRITQTQMVDLKGADALAANANIANLSLMASFSLPTLTGVTSDNFVYFGGSAFSKGTFKISYSYTPIPVARAFSVAFPVPEPSDVLGLMTILALGVGTLLKRKLSSR